jgi:uncharacterized protein YjbI with pentapeptide repeats
MAKRYEFTGETEVYAGRTLHRIRALVDIPTVGVAAGDLGGWIESEDNLPHDGTAWVFPAAKVMGTFTRLWGGSFRGGDFRGGTFWGGTFEGGTFRGGTFEGGTFWGGTFWGGTFEGGDFRGGDFRGGTFWGGTFWGGTFEGGTFWGGTFEGGTFEGGTFEGGTFWGGDFEGGTSTKLQPLYLAGLCWQITITDEHMTIGCETHKLSDWWAFDDSTIDAMDRNDALPFWRAHKATLRALCAATGRIAT